MSDTEHAPEGKLTAFGEQEQLAEDLQTEEACLTITRGVVFFFRMTIIRLPHSTDLVLYSSPDPYAVMRACLGKEIAGTPAMTAAKMNMQSGETVMVKSAVPKPEGKMNWASKLVHEDVVMKTRYGLMKKVGRLGAV